jgi:hypothetical protein
VPRQPNPKRLLGSQAALGEITIRRQVSSSQTPSGRPSAPAPAFLVCRFRSALAQIGGLIKSRMMCFLQAQGHERARRFPSGRGNNRSHLAPVAFATTSANSAALRERSVPLIGTSNLQARTRRGRSQARTARRCLSTKRRLQHCAAGAPAKGCLHAGEQEKKQNAELCHRIADWAPGNRKPNIEGPSRMPPMICPLIEG